LFAIVPLVAETFVREILPAERVVIVAFVRVALLDVRYEVEAVKIFATSEFVVEAFKFWKLPVVDHRVVMKAVTALRIDAARLPVEVRFETVVEPSVDEPVIFTFANVPVAEFRTVVVAFVIVPFVADTFVREILPAERVVIVAFVNVALIPVRLLTYDVEA
jgi:hypothetical protein